MTTVRSGSSATKRKRLSKRLASQFITFTGLVSLICAVYSYCQLRREAELEVEVPSLPGSLHMDPLVDPCLGKEKYLRILQQAGLPPHLVNPDLCRQLPTEQQVSQLYGNEPIVHGLDTCEKYRAHLKSANNETVAPMVRVTGLFNTGTNALHMALHVNLNEGKKREITDPDEIEMLYGVPWFKHFPLEARTNWAQGQSPTTVDRILTIVLVRDPYRWMQSMVSFQLAFSQRSRIQSSPVSP